MDKEHSQRARDTSKMTEKATDNALLFSFGVITDTHIRAPEGDLSSPYAVNELANERAGAASELLATYTTEFNVHLGDMVHPLPGMPAYNGACEAALEIFKPLQPDLYFVPGNHDIGDKPMPGLPAAVVTDAAVQAYSEYFGDDYYCFERNDCLFIVLDSSLINCDASGKQSAWLLNVLSQNPYERIFIFLHYPPFINSENEPEHYDNLAEPGRSWLLDLIRQHNVEMVLSGHVHHHFYNRVAACKCYTISPTSFTRQDYAELFKVGPSAEFGRDDTGKYGVAIVDVFESGHQLRFIPTNGECGSSAIAESSAKAEPSAQLAVTELPLTVPLRHAWYESIDLPYNGPMEEFSRKRARNDYIFMRLRQMGIKDVRVPIDDVIDPLSRARVADYVADGFRFHGFCPQYLFSEKLAQAGQGASLLVSLECVANGPVDSIDEPALSGIGVPLSIGYALTGAHRSDSDKPFAHTVSSGFLWKDHKAIIARTSTWTTPLEGVVFQIPWEDNAVAILKEMQSVFASLPFKCIACIRLAKSNPAESNFDDRAIQSRIQSVVNFLESLPDIKLQLDTCMDVDRGYSPRHGLFDRLINLRAAGQSLAKQQLVSR